MTIFAGAERAEEPRLRRFGLAPPKIAQTPEESYDIPVLVPKVINPNNFRSHGTALGGPFYRSPQNMIVALRGSNRDGQVPKRLNWSIRVSEVTLFEDKDLFW